MKGAIDGEEGNNQQARFTCNRRAATSPDAAARSKPPRHQGTKKCGMGRRGHRARRGSRTGMAHAPRMHSRPDRQGWLSEPSARLVGACPARSAVCHGHPCPWAFPGSAGFQARKPSRKPLASPCACPLRGVAFCSGTPPRSDRGCGGLRAPLPSAREAAPLQKGECVAATHFVAERLRVPTGGAVGCGPHSRRRGKPRRYKKANAPPRIL